MRFPAALLWDLRKLPEEELPTVLKDSQGAGDQAGICSGDIMWLKQCNKPPMTRNGLMGMVNIPPMKMLIGGWFSIVLATLVGI